MPVGPVRRAIAMLLGCAAAHHPAAAQTVGTPAPPVEGAVQDPAGPDQGTGTGDIVVTGQRRAQQESIATKRDSFAIVDAVSSDDIGKLPDHNTAAALRRIPGVSVQEDQGEPRFPVLRGCRRPTTAPPSTARSCRRWTRADAPFRSTSYLR